MKSPVERGPSELDTHTTHRDVQVGRESERAGKREKLLSNFGCWLLAGRQGAKIEVAGEGGGAGGRRVFVTFFFRPSLFFLVFDEKRGTPADAAALALKFSKAREITLKLKLSHTCRANQLLSSRDGRW